MSGGGGSAVSAGAGRDGVARTTSWPRSISAAANTGQTASTRADRKAQHMRSRTENYSQRPAVRLEAIPGIKSMSTHDAHASTRDTMGLTWSRTSFRGSGRPVDTHAQAVSDARAWWEGMVAADPVPSRFVPRGVQ